MHSRISNLCVGVAGLLASTLAPACSSGGDEGVLITKNVAIVAGAECVTTGAPSEPFQPHGYVDPEADRYLIHPQFESRIKTDVLGDPTQDAQRTVEITDVDVDITFPGSTLFSSGELSQMATAGLTHFKALGAVPVPPNGGTADGEFDVVPRGLLDAIAQKQGGTPADVEMQLAIVGNGTMSGEPVTSQKFLYPVTVTPLAQNLGDCPLPVGTVLTTTGNSCNPFQDSPVQCCAGSDGGLVCPADIATM